MFNRKKNMSSAWILLAGLSVSHCARAQQQITLATPLVQIDTSKYTIYRTNPVWQEMLDDSSANFFEVQKAYALFWAGKEIPGDENEIIGDGPRLKNNLVNKLFNAKELEEQKERDQLSFSCKKYRWWVIKTEPFVQEDGSILPPYERLKLWKKHSDELNDNGNK
jgi:hypothetical protein